MSNFIEQLHIKNFKSIKSSHIDGCKRINLFIGRPNVGKSNILEALSVFSIPFLKENKSKSLTNLIRLENETELFYSGNFDDFISIHSNIGNADLRYDKNQGIEISIDTVNGGAEYLIDEKLNLRSRRRNDDYDPIIKKYTFSIQTTFKRSHSRYLIPPFGYNLLNVIERNGELKDEVSNLFKDYNLSLVFDKASQSLKILQPEKKDIFLIPYNSIADTLQRIIFFKTAIASNNNSILLFEEPEAHSFPPYITHITQEMIYKKDNQFFIATHSPFILNDLLENARDELSVFVVDYKKNETKVKRLSDSELHEIYQNGVDLFTNNESYL
ncbi:ATPase/GTPase, AAA15 family [Mucilaginibacter lappiensis]|uniref:ATPase AAA-type core domain-containing protein n=1 Tax=Mucilaginibacter lappiensis TaxID=354630 RepID=A0ABR6PKD7_9SPHI|nr:AAA family ATPase [Mucilaginibacter lappiensis]MBB6108706.1 hypothetical protein [Mucilaginibacter lappiensis]SIQ27085.1 ATPase/GTPase, AAA15 family [Mucilaginibacter lappiensis]